VTVVSVHSLRREELELRIRRSWLAVVLMLLLQPTLARAHDHTADLFGAFSFARASNLWGLHESLALTLPSPSNRDLSLVADLSLHIGTHDDKDLTRVTFLGGFRYTLSGRRLLKHLVSFHALAGGVHDGGPASGTEPALALGGGYEYLPRGSESAAGWGFRVQGDYVISGGENFPRLSAGIVYRIKE
jgi:hypothetical protein